MLKDNIRKCDVCDGAIPKGEKYRVSTIPKDKAILFGARI
jgi:hypothetical protein